MMGAFKAPILGLHKRPYCLISMDNSLQTIKETKAVQNSLNFGRGIESLRALVSRRDYFLTSTCLINGIKKQYLAQMKMTLRHLHLWLLPDIISLYLSTANSSVDVLEGRVGSNIFLYNPLQILGESPDQSRELFEWTPRKNEYNYFYIVVARNQNRHGWVRLVRKPFPVNNLGGAIPTCDMFWWSCLVYVCVKAPFTM